MKWENYTKTTWEPVEHFDNSRESIDDFETAQAQVIIGLKKTDSAYAIKFKYGAVRLIEFDEVQTKWPELLEKFYTERIHFTMINCVPTNELVETPKSVILINSVSRILGTFNFL